MSAELFGCCGCASDSTCDNIVLTEIGTCGTAFLQEWTFLLVVTGSILFLTALIAVSVGIFLTVVGSHGLVKGIGMEN